MNLFCIDGNDPHFAEFNCRQYFTFHYRLLHFAQQAPRIHRRDTNRLCLLSQFVDLSDVPRGATHVVLVYKRELGALDSVRIAFALFAVADKHLQKLELVGRAQVL